VQFIDVTKKNKKSPANNLKLTEDLTIPTILQPNDSMELSAKFTVPEGATEKYIECKMRMWDPIRERKFGDEM